MRTISSNSAQRSVWSDRTLIGVVAFALALAWLLLLGGSSVALAAEEENDELPTLCAGVTAISPEECGALVMLYEETNGPNWANNANWLQVDGATSPCDWYGVTCANGGVDELRLNGNGLGGRLPAAVGQLTNLRVLDLSGNRLGPRIASQICALTATVADADFGYNRLDVRSAATRTCLDEMDPDWRQTQTVAPRDLAPNAFTATGIELSWTPIPYNDDGGYYEVSYSETFSGDYTVHGTTAGRAAAGYLVDGLEPGTSYFLRVEAVTPAHANHPDILVSDAVTTIGVTASAERVLLAAVISADNNLSSYVPSIIRRMARGSALNPNLTAIVLSDQRRANDTRVTLIENGTLTQLDIVSQVWGTEELDMADPDVLSWFLRYARETVQSDRTIVSLIGHGVGPTPDLAWVPPAQPDEPLPPPVDGIPPLPRGLEFTPADVTDGSYLSTLDLARALLDATDDGANPFDILFFDQCFQGNLDVLYEVRAAAEIFIASPNYAWLVAPYAQYIARMAPAADNAAIAADILSRYEANLNNRHPNAIFWARSSDIDNIAVAVSDLGEALLGALDGGEAATIRAAALDASYVDTTQCGAGEFVLGPPDELMGAGSFALQLRNRVPENDAYGVHGAAGALIDALRELSSASRTGSPYLAPDSLWNYNDRITILAPLPRNLPASVVWRASVYQAGGDRAAVWTPDPSQTVLVQGNFAFVEAYQWDEFINAWYGELTPTIGNWCHYTPPSIVLDEESETLALQGEVNEAGELVLDWSEPQETDAAGYQLFARLPFGIDLELIDTLPNAATAATLDDLLPGAYSLRIVAVDESDAALAQSNEIELTVPWASQLFLPLIER